MRRGEIRDFGERFRGVVVSPDEDDRPLAWVVLASRKRVTDPHVLRVNTNEADPISGSFLVEDLVQMSRSHLAGEPVGILSGATMARVDAGLRAMLGL